MKPVLISAMVLMGMASWAQAQTPQQWDQCVERVGRSVDVQEVGQIGYENAIKDACGVRPVSNAGMAKPKIMMAAVTSSSQRRRPMLSASLPATLINTPNTTAPIIKKPVNVLAGIPKPMGCPAGERVAGLLENTCTNAVIT